VQSQECDFGHLGSPEAAVSMRSLVGDARDAYPHFFLFRFRNILVSHQAVSLTFYNKIASMAVSN